ncbi:MAG: cob(I)yrinic acid a,c-diamide adenosyltransferase [Candidatus Beckwithbacteria bacterium]|nr:cob(I)yrinic acid a,c-diamide adenosyltransferase [Candidatus Beckwithbacteria bacterium]
MNTKGLVYVFTGNGKGKTSVALGVAVRAVCAGKKVGWVSWYKEERWPISEKKLKLKNLKMYWLGKGFYKLPTDHASPQKHREAALAGLAQAKKFLGKVDVLILDEVNNAVHDKLINLSALINLISKRGKTHLILTGRGAARRLLAGADLVTEMKKIKHPFDKGIKAVKGLDY